MAIASRSTSQTQIVERFADDVTNDHVAVLFQVIRLPKQVRPPMGAMPAHTRPVQTLARPHTRAPARLKPQAYVYIGLADDARSSLQSMSMGMMAGAAPISTVVLPSTSKARNNDSESQQLAQMLCRKAGMPVMVSYNVPTGSVTDAVRSRISGFAATCLCT